MNLRQQVQAAKKYEQCLASYQGRTGIIERVYKARGEDLVKARLALSGRSPLYVQLDELKILS
jgi:hypothetical protein